MTELTYAAIVTGPGGAFMTHKLLCRLVLTCSFGSMRWVFLLLVLFLTSCASTPEPEVRVAEPVKTIDIRSWPPGLVVELNGEYVGTPLWPWWSRPRGTEFGRPTTAVASAPSLCGSVLPTLRGGSKRSGILETAFRPVFFFAFPAQRSVLSSINAGCPGAGWASLAGRKQEVQAKGRSPAWWARASGPRSCRL